MYTINSFSFSSTRPFDLYTQKSVDGKKNKDENLSLFLWKQAAISKISFQGKYLLSLKKKQACTLWNCFEGVHQGIKEPIRTFVRDGITTTNYKTSLSNTFRDSEGCGRCQVSHR